MAEQTTITVLDLPKFRGNPKRGEIGFTPGVDVKTFFRSLDNHFSQKNITDNDAKVRTVFAQIDKERGNAIDWANMYAGKCAKYEDVKAEFFHAYPNFISSEFRHAANALADISIHTDDTFSDATRLEVYTRALVEAFVNKREMNALGITSETEIDIVGAQTITVPELLQNMILHMIVAQSVPIHIYEKLTGITPNISSTNFMALVIENTSRQTVEEGLRRRNAKKKIDENQAVFKIERSSQKENYYNKSKTCYKCGMKNHISKDCRVDTYCSHCKVKSHNTSVCRKKKAHGKYCAICKRKDSHDTKDCYSNKKKYPQSVKILEETSVMEDVDKEYEYTDEDESDQQ